MPADMATERMKGEWLINASIMQCHDALLGRIHLTENGEVVYLAAGGDLIGRGVGKWFMEGTVLGFQADIFQYAASTTAHVPQEPHRFRAVGKMPPDSESKWSGEWYFLAFNQPPRLVGCFQCIRRSSGPLKSTSTVGRVEDCRADAKRAVVAKLDRISIVPSLSEKRWTSHHVADRGVSSVHYVRNFLDAKHIDEVMKAIDRTCEFEKMTTRDTQEFGSSTRCPCGRSLLRVDLPSWQESMISALHNLGAFHPVLYPANSVRINAYAPGQGIHPHMDGPVYYPRAAIVTLGSQCVFNFYPREDIDEDKRGFSWDRDKEVPSAPDLPPNTQPQLSMLLEPGSLLVFSGEAFTNHRHGIKAVEEDEIDKKVYNAKDIGLSVGDNLKRGRRVSLTIRHLLPRCMCSSIG